MFTRFAERLRLCTIIDELLDPGTIEKVHSELRPHLERLSTGKDEFAGHETRRAGSIVERSPTLRPLVMYPLVHDAATLRSRFGVRAGVRQLPIFFSPNARHDILGAETCAAEDKHWPQGRGPAFPQLTCLPPRRRPVACPDTQVGS